jgi:hypothetical protein
VDHVIRATVIVSATAAGTLLALTALATRGHDRGAVACAPESLVPAYLPPRAITALAGSPHLPRLLVVNPASGPGTEPHPPFRDAVRAAQQAGARVLGYVHTGWGARDAGDVERDIDRYVEWYGTDGVFLDEAAHDPALAGHYRTLAAHARASGDRFVALNPGVVPARAYFSFADAIVTFEGSVEEYADRLETMPAWLSQVPPDRIAHLVYGATREQALELAAGEAQAGRLYVTSGALPDPWSALPDYLADEQAALGGCT